MRIEPLPSFSSCWRDALRRRRPARRCRHRPDHERERGDAAQPGEQRAALRRAAPARPARTAGPAAARRASRAGEDARPDVAAFARAARERQQQHARRRRQHQHERPRAGERAQLLGPAQRRSPAQPAGAAGGVGDHPQHARARRRRLRRARARPRRVGASWLATAPTPANTGTTRDCARARGRPTPPSGSPPVTKPGELGHPQRQRAGPDRGQRRAVEPCGARRPGEHELGRGRPPPRRAARARRRTARTPRRRSPASRRRATRCSRRPSAGRAARRRTGAAPCCSAKLRAKPGGPRPPDRCCGSRPAGCRSTTANRYAKASVRARASRSALARRARAARRVTPR